MRIYYCDGSQHKELQKQGVGVVSDDFETYLETEEFDWKQQTHEISAIEKTIEIAVHQKSNPIVVISDDKHLVGFIKKTFSSLKRYNKVKEDARYKRLISLIHTHHVKLRTPQTIEEKVYMKRAHHLSRSYLDTSL